MSFVSSYYYSNRDKNVSLVIVPPKTKLDDLLYIDNKSVIPITNNRQIQTVIQAKDGQSSILGGLVGEESRNNDTGVPILKARTPVQ
ncbi:hypothetical protein [Photobacterium phosphoreum]|uniref:hypothetical protein n=1 Tax=Photobacterium phosphoreum TaxID=659 RepID=UPI000D17C113|nr:hypothetical protein [Photobacterium phosphoreum]PSU80695.1 hypothetical protein CTM67_10360 [Photobacterium phosphoreum]